MKTVNKIEELTNKYGKTCVNMGIAQLMETGAKSCRNITDKDLENCQGNDLMTKEFVQGIFQVARELANYSLFELLKYYQHKAERMQCIAYNAICLGDLEERYDYDDLLNELGCDEEELDEIMGRSEW